MGIGRQHQRALVTIDEGCNLREAAQLMRDQHVGALVVTTLREESRDAVGVITDRDIADAVAAHGLSPTAVLVAGVASRPPRFIEASASAAEVAAEMARSGTRRLLLVDDDDGVVGLVSSDDLLSLLLEPLLALARLAQAEVDEEAARPGRHRATPPCALRIRDLESPRAESPTARP